MDFIVKRKSGKNAFLGLDQYLALDFKNFLKSTVRLFRLTNFSVPSLPLIHLRVKTIRLKKGL